jgi:transposase-like protein
LNYYNSYRRDRLKFLTVGSASGWVVRTDQGGASEIVAQLIVTDQVLLTQGDDEHPLRDHRLDAVLGRRERSGCLFVVITEDQAVPFVRHVVAPGSTVYADESASWDALHVHYDARRINHSVAFHDEGVDTNQAESFFSRMRRAEIGQHHCVSRHLRQYAGEMAWREDNRRSPTGRSS